MTLQDGERAAERAAETRRRHGDDFYARIGRRSWEVRRRARSGDAEAEALVQRRRDARARRGGVWQELVAAQGAVSLLRDELRSRAAANVEPSRSLSAQHFRYTDRLRDELRRVEERLAQLRAEHQAILATLQPAAEPSRAP